MTKQRFILGSWVSSVCLALGVASAYAQEPPHGPRMLGHDMKPNNDAKPGSMSERRGGPPELLPSGRPQPHPGGAPGEQMRENMERHKMHDMMRGRDASAPPPPFARGGDAGVRRRHRSMLTPEQIAKRNEQLARLHAKFGNELLERRDARMELNTHAWRIARLQRMRTLAEEQKKPKLVERIDALIKKENEHHAKRMERLRGGDAGVAPPPRPGPAPSAKGQSKTGGQP